MFSEWPLRDSSAVQLEVLRLAYCFLWTRPSMCVKTGQRYFVKKILLICRQAFNLNLVTSGLNL